MQVTISAPNKALVIPVTGITTQLFPEAPCIDYQGRRCAVIPHAPRESLLLRKAGYRVPNPILSYYDWCGGKPFSVQKATCAMLTVNPRAYVLNDMGTGKTRAALWAWDYLNRSGVAGKLLIVAPLSTLNFVWAREVLACVPHRKVSVLHGSAQTRHVRLNADADIYIINHDGLRVVQEELSKRTDIDTLVLDELAVYRNPSDRSKQMRKFAQRFAWVWGMTGSPMPQAPTDVWAQCMIVTPGKNGVPGSKSYATSALMTRISQFIWKPKANAVDTALAWMQPNVRFSLDDVVELPEAIHRTVDVDLTPEQGKVYTKLARELAVMIKEQKITAVNAGVAMNKLLQVATGFVYTTNPEYVTLDSRPRMDTMVELVKSASHKVIIFAPYRHLVQGLAECLTKADIEHAVVDETVNRDEIFHAFQNTEKYRVLLAHPKRIHHGLTLTAADTILWYAPVPSLEIYEQANARIRRVGQKHKQQFIHLQGTPVEQKIYALLKNKQKLQDRFLDLLEIATGERDGEH